MAGKPFVLVVDDDKASVKLMARYLDALGYACQTALSGEEAFEILRADPASVGMVLLDLAMPNMNGYEVCRAIRADPVLAHIPVVAFTADVVPQLREEAAAAGIDDVITKPFSYEDLNLILANYFGPG